MSKVLEIKAKKVEDLLRSLGYEGRDSLEDLSLDCTLDGLQDFFCIREASKVEEDSQALDYFLEQVLVKMKQHLTEILPSAYDKVYGC